MVEAKVTCLCSAVKLQDLGQSLVKGQTVYLDAEAARKSQDLALTVRAGGLTLAFVERCTERRLPSTRQRQVAVQPVPAAPKILTEPVTPKEDLLEAIRAEFRILHASMRASLADLTLALPTSSGGTSGTIWGSPDAASPRFIPHGLVVGNATMSENAVETGQASGDPVDAASAALKQIKRKKK